MSLRATGRNAACGSVEVAYLGHVGKRACRDGAPCILLGHEESCEVAKLARVLSRGLAACTHEREGDVLVAEVGGDVESPAAGAYGAPVREVGVDDHALLCVGHCRQSRPCT